MVGTLESSSIQRNLPTTEGGEEEAGRQLKERGIEGGIALSVAIFKECL